MEDPSFHETVAELLKQAGEWGIVELWQQHENGYVSHIYLQGIEETTCPFDGTEIEGECIS